MNQAGRPRTVLMNPGPVMTDARVHDALTVPDMCHREPEFADLMQRVADKLVRAAGGDENHAAVVITGSGTAAIEGALGSVVPARGSLLVIENGTYGDRLTTIARALGISTTPLELGLGTPVSLEAVARALGGGRHTHVALVHHETSTGMLNPVSDVARLAHRAGAQVIVDAVSSFGAEPLSVHECDWVVGSSNKCLEGKPGLSFVVARRDSLAEIGRRPARSFYLDLGRHHAAQSEVGAPAFTPAIPAYHALDVALDLLLEESVAGRHERYGELARVLREGLGELGLELVLPPEHRSVCLTLLKLPGGLTYARLHDAVKALGYVIYAAQTTLQAGHFRLSTMGQMKRTDVEGFLDALREVLPPDDGGQT